MTKKQIVFLIFSILIIALNFYFGNAISSMLTVAIVGTCAYYLLQLNIEEQIQQKAKTINVDDTDAILHLSNFATQRTNLFSILLLSIVFVFSLIAIKKIVNPTTNTPWFFNNDHHAISNTAIGFEEELHFLYVPTDSTHLQGNIDFLKIKDEVYLQTKNVYKPIFLQLPNKDNQKIYKIINPIYTTPFDSEFELRNTTTAINVMMQWKKPNVFATLKGNLKRDVTYNIQLQCTDTELLSSLHLENPYQDNITIIDDELMQGKSLYNLFINTENWKSNKPESQQLLERILAQIDETYLLANYNEQGNKKYIVFPDDNCIQNNYGLYIHGIRQSTNLNAKLALAHGANFHIGFNNANKKMRWEEKENRTALVFDFATPYLLSHPVEAKLGDKHLRFITTQYNDVITNPLHEGFYFANENLHSNYAVNAQMEFTSDAPKYLLTANCKDMNSGKLFSDFEKPIWLQTQDAGVQYCIEMRDFSNNGFSNNKLIQYACYLYILFCAILLFARNKKLNRIEPIIFTVIYALLMVRFIMYWRIATFPPLENISKFELEKTLLGFDFNLFGIPFPFPITLFFVSMIALAIVIYRWLQQHKPNVVNITILKNKNWKLVNIKNINKVHALLMIILLGLHFIIHIEILRRLIDVILPILIYHYCCQLANKYFVPSDTELVKGEYKVLRFIRVLAYYFLYNPTFIITVSTLLFFAIADRGFCVLFILFVLLKNVLLNFLKKSYDDRKQTVAQMFLKPWNYWVYGAIALVNYLIVLGFKSLFYYVLIYKLWVVLLLLLIVLGCGYLFYNKSKLFYTTAIIACLYTVILLIPTARKVLDAKITNAIKHVQFRASIIHQPIHSLLVNNAYNSFNTKKIIETAENQWFINTYISKAYDNDKQINLRAFSKIGVNYNTQTRDVVLARFVISEMGQITMILLLILLALPMFIYLLSYKIRKESIQVQTISFDVDSYAGLIPLLLLFTISLFVWLTATNRFVFFGQDFPFLSLTSRVSVLVPMLLLMLTLIQSPIAYNVNNINIKLGISRYLLLLGVIIIVAITTFKQNELSANNFNVEVAQTKQLIEGPFHQILHQVQDSLNKKNIKFNYTTLITSLKNNERYQIFKTEKVTDTYTKSILDALEKNPNIALRANSPLYIVYDKGMYDALYNKNLYLELPTVENKKVWNGNISESLATENNIAFVHYSNVIHGNVPIPFFKNDNINALQLAILPKNWFVNANEHIGIINVQNQNGKPAHISIYKNKSKNTEQKANQFVQTIAIDDLVIVDANEKPFQINFANNNHLFATNKWLNGGYKTLYPQKENNFWMYHFANAIKNVYTQQNDLQKNINITLDYNWALQTQNICNKEYSNRKSTGVKFTVIAADGDGNIRLMNDYVKNRKPIDPNDENKIYSLQQKHFFYSNTGNERDQWANANLIHLHLGPGSSIKPLVAATIASQTNAGWEKIKLNYTNIGNQINYAGLPLAQQWEEDPDSYDGQGMSDYIRKSSNYYHSILMFLGSYAKADFMDSLQHANVKNIVKLQAGKNNSFPKFTIDGIIYSLPNYENGKGNWPTSDKSKTSKSYFANENSILANGLEINAGLACKDKDKGDMNILNSCRTNFTDSTIYSVLVKNKSSSFIWGFPEESAFPQINRHFISSKQKNEINENFNLGLKTATLGGYPYQLTPYKMLEMYNALFTQNRNYEMHVLPKKNKYVAWQIDSTWSRKDYNQFLARYIFKGMEDVIGSGTATGLVSLKAQHSGYYFYAKTGTINEGGSSASNSRRLIVTITNKDMTNPENISKDTKVFSYYFVTDNTGDFNWEMLRTIINQGFLHPSFIQYFKKP